MRRGRPKRHSGENRRTGGKGGFAVRECLLSSETSPAAQHHHSLPFSSGDSSDSRRYPKPCSKLDQYFTFSTQVGKERPARPRHPENSSRAGSFFILYSEQPGVAAKQAFPYFEHHPRQQRRHRATEGAGAPALKPSNIEHPSALSFVFAVSVSVSSSLSYSLILLLFRPKEVTHR